MILYFPSLPIDTAYPHITSHIKENRAQWRQQYGDDVLHSLETLGQLNPCIITYWPKLEQWLISPGQTRWYAMRELGWKTFKAVLNGDTNPYPEHEHQELDDLDAVLELYDPDFPNHVDRKWFEVRGWQ